VAAALFQRLVVAGVAARGRMQAETLLIDAQLRWNKAVVGRTRDSA
jgi:hypothetical protein